MQTLNSALALLVLVACVAHGEVVDSTARGFTVRDTVSISRSPLDVYHHIVKDVGRWWSPAHTSSGDASNLSIEDKAQGCFCEKMQNGGSVRHMEVVYASPGSKLRMLGALGPLQALAVNGTMTWSLLKSDGGTLVEVTYAVGGYRPGGLGLLAAPVDNVIMEQLKRLKKFIETGTAE